MRFVATSWGKLRDVLRVPAAGAQGAGGVAEKLFTHDTLIVWSVG